MLTDEQLWQRDMPESVSERIERVREMLAYHEDLPHNEKKPGWEWDLIDEIPGLLDAADELQAKLDEAQSQLSCLLYGVQPELPMEASDANG